MAYSVFKGIFPVRESKYRNNSVRGPECPLNASFVRDMYSWKRKEFISRDDTEPNSTKVNTNLDDSPTKRK